MIFLQVLKGKSPYSGTMGTILFTILRCLAKTIVTGSAEPASLFIKMKLKYRNDPKFSDKQV